MSEWWQREQAAAVNDRLGTQIGKAGQISGQHWSKTRDKGQSEFANDAATRATDSRLVGEDGDGITMPREHPTRQGHTHLLLCDRCRYPGEDACQLLVERFAQ